MSGVVAAVFLTAGGVADAQNIRTGPDAAYGVPQLSLSRPNLTFTTGIGGLNPVGNPVFPDLRSQDAQEVYDAHNWARQETLLCLMYLRARKNEILAGQDEFYNSLFGRFYDRSNPFSGTYTIDESHYNQVLNTFNTIRFLLESPTSYGYGTGGQTSYGTIFGYDRGLRQWGYSTSSSRDHLDDIIQAYTVNTGATSAPVFPPRRWDADNTPWRQSANTDSIAQRIANLVDRAFFTEKLDIYGSADNANAVANGGSSSQFLGNVFFYNPDSTDFFRRLGERRSLGLDGELSGIDWENGDLEFNVDRTGRILVDYNLGGINGALFGDGTAGRFNSNQPFNMNDIDGDGVLDYDPFANTRPYIDFVRYPTSAFNSPQLRQFQMIMMSTAEFTTTIGDRRGGAFAGVLGLLRVLDPTGRASMLYGGSVDAKQYALFSEVLNRAGITDPRRFPPAGKNVRAFNPAIPSS